MFQKMVKMLASLTVLVLAVFVGSFVYENVMNTNSEKIAYFADSVMTIIPTPNKVGWTKDYREVSEELDRVYDTNSELKENGQIYEARNLVNNEASDLYVQSFLNRLIVQRDKLRTVYNLNAGETTVDYLNVINEVRIEVRSLEQQFLEGEDFAPVEVTLSNGETVIDMGVNGNERQAVDEETLTKEDKAKNSYAKGSSSRDEAESLASEFELELVYGLNNMSQECLKSYDEDSLSHVVALMCSSDMSKIYVNVNHKDGDVSQSLNFLDYIKHEIAHKMIFEVCGTMAPEITGENYESVTSSYAVKYLGANYIVLQSSADDFDAYRMDNNSDSIAEKIHDEGLCVG